jgi:hypothetical protein
MAGFQMIQTDYPWHFVHDGAPGLGIPTDPSQRIKTFGGGSAVREPGQRIYFHTEGGSGQTWAYRNVPPVSQRWWEATVSTSRNGDTWGERTHDGLILDDYLKRCPEAGLTRQDLCTSFDRRAQDGGEGSITVSSADGSNRMMIGRQKNTTPGASFYQEGVDLYIRVSRAGQAAPDVQLKAPRYSPCRRDFDPNSDGVSNVCIGSMIALAVDNQGPNKSEVTVYSAGKLDSSGRPDWHPLLTQAFDRPMTRQGFAAFGDVLLAGARTAEGLVPGPSTPLRDVALSDLPERQIPAGQSATTVDLSFR